MLFFRLLSLRAIQLSGAREPLSIVNLLARQWLTGTEALTYFWVEAVDSILFLEVWTEHIKAHGHWRPEFCFCCTCGLALWPLILILSLEVRRYKRAGLRQRG